MIKNFTVAVNETKFVKYVRLDANAKVWNQEIWETKGSVLSMTECYEANFSKKDVTRKEVLEAFA